MSLTQFDSLRTVACAGFVPIGDGSVLCRHMDKFGIGADSLLRLSVGDEAEVAFDGIPGRVFEGRVKTVVNVIAEGQVQSSGTLIGFTGSPPAGRVPVIIEITDPDCAQSSSQMPGGAYGQAALYCQHFEHIAMMRKFCCAWLPG